MDWDLLMGAFSSLNAAKDLAATALKVRDINQSGAQMSEMYGLLLKAQEGLIAHNAQLAKLQQENFEGREEIRKLRESIAQRDRYTLFELSDGVMVYRVDVTPRLSGAGDPIPTEPEHYVCQRCADKGIKSVLQKTVSLGTVFLTCQECKVRYPTGERRAMPNLGHGTR